MIRPARGYSLLLALAALFGICAALLLVGRAMARNSESSRGAAGREVAVRACESALERARGKFEAGELSAGAIQIDGLTVRALTVGKSVQLETWSPWAAPARPEALKRVMGTRVTWDMRRPYDRWIREGWTAHDETRPEASRAP